MILPRKLRTDRLSTSLACLSILISPVSVAEDSPTKGQAVTTTSAISASTMLLPLSLEQHGARIGSINVVTDNIFDSDDPEESRALHRLANKLHITTRPEVIRTQLLFEPGDAISAQQLGETERLLRSNRYLREATITPVNLNGDVVDLEVRTSDVWTLNPSISFGRRGGKNSGGVGLKEFNLLGSGTSIGLGYKSNVDRDSLSLKYFDRNLLSSRYRLIAEYTNASDGYSQRLGLERPFFALDTRRAIGANFQSGRQTESLYDEGEIAQQFELSSAKHEFHMGWSNGLQDNWSKRYFTGVGFDSREYGPVIDGLYPASTIPDDKRFVYPFVGIELLQNDYVTTRNFDQMNRTEDRHLGMRASFQLGYADRTFGSYDSAWLYQGQFSNTLLRTPRSTFVVGADLTGRLERGETRNARLTLSGRYDKRQSENRLLHVSLTASAGQNLDLENTTYIGGDIGLRGYPLRYQAGDSSILFTLEQRLFTDWYPFRLFNVGGAAFFDAGRTWGRDPVAGTNYGWLKNIGVGLRIGSTRSGIGRMIHIDLAYPLDGGKDISKVQLLVEARKGF